MPRRRGDDADGPAPGDGGADGRGSGDGLEAAATAACVHEDDDVTARDATHPADPSRRPGRARAVPRSPRGPHHGGPATTGARAGRRRAPRPGQDPAATPSARPPQVPQVRPGRSRRHRGPRVTGRRESGRGRRRAGRFREPSRQGAPASRTAATVTSRPVDARPQQRGGVDDRSPASRREPSAGLAQHVVPLAEGEPDQGAGRVLVVVEDRHGHPDDARHLRQASSELEPVDRAERRRVRDDEVGAGRPETARPAVSSASHSRSRPRSSESEMPAYTSSPRPSARATAGWNGPEPTKVRNCLTVRAAATASAGPESQPTFQPVAENVLPAEEMVMRPVDHAGQGRDGHVLGAVEDEVLVDLVGDDPRVVLAGRAMPRARARRA